ncbi:MAG: hypothetical protein ACOC29_03565 [Candidatus Sumerlaeota bacterium]
MAPEQSELSVIIYTTHHRIEGLLTLLKGEQMSDKLNIDDRRFEAIREARVHSIKEDKLLHESPYLAVNKDHITLMLPAEEA